MVLIIISLLLLSLYTCLLLFYLAGWKRVQDYEPTDAEPKFLSIIIAARNEENNIEALLDALQKQTYPINYFEVIIVDDYSTDGTSDKVLSHKLSNIKLIKPEVTPEQSSKKKAIEAGIRHARGEMIITTDADCIPPPDWLQIINSYQSENKANFIAAPVRLQNNNSILHIFQALDFLTLQGITAASVNSGFHAMCNGANLAYTKQAFNNVNGFKGIDKVATGDDMLLMHKIWKEHPGTVYYLKSQHAIVNTQPMHSWNDFFMQRRRWASKTLIYNDKRIIAVLALVYLVNLLFLALVIAALIDSWYWWMVAGYLLFKSIIEIPFVYRVAYFFEQQKLIRYFFFFQPVHIIYTIFAGTLSQFGKYEWKGRKTK